ncbi:MAG: aminomethyl-transferring glycine dehydrogenase subunit GcvPB [Elusimicrobia bacterium]|nr:aminomethyl-transferring glycine dehydrogenase subunit GcvPB [Elusimicrobiota bacterium]
MRDDSALSIEKSIEGRRAIRFNKINDDSISIDIPDNFLRKTKPHLPQLSELDAVRHFTKLSRRSFSLDTHFYPLGSCTMKYNPKINEDISMFEGFANLHPFCADSSAQGTLEMLYDAEKILCEICGMDAMTLQPAAGAHSEFTGALIAKAYFEKKGEKQRTEIIVPDSAHGTNPATAVMLGFNTVNIKSNADGQIDLAALKAAVSDKTAVLMLTVPNTLGIFEFEIEEITRIAHEAGALVYMDGANFNALMGIIKPGNFGIDIMHLNMHKTFSTPHGGGGPGAGAIGVTKLLEEFLPYPRIVKENDEFKIKEDYPNSIGKIKAYFGNVGVHLKAYAYLLMHSKENLGEVAKNAIINANYLLKKLKKIYPAYCDDYCMHECVLTPAKDLTANKVKTLDIGKRLLDYGFHAPTVYFPLIVHEAIMIEPTETESKETLDLFIEAMEKIFEEGKNNPQIVKTAPHTLCVKRLDEVAAARKPNVKWKNQLGNSAVSQKLM